MDQAHKKGDLELEKASKEQADAAAAALQALCSMGM